MRIEARAEVDEHEYSVTLECDRGIDIGVGIQIASKALVEMFDRASLI